MATLLLIIIYIGYIGLGIPDSLFGTAWPMMHEELALPVWMAGYITPVMSIFTMIASVFSGRLINRFGTGRVAAVSTAMTVMGLFGYYVAPNVWIVLLCAFPLGFGAGAVDAGLNGYVAQHYNAMHMNFLHCFYGIGVSVSPYVMSVALEKLGGWRIGYRNAALIQLCIAVILFLAIPLWGKVKHKNKEENVEPSEVKIVPLRQLAKNPAVRWVWLSFFASCALEHTCGTWGSTFLVQTKDMGADAAARILVLYYVGLALGRFLSGLFSVKFTSWQIIFAGFGVLTAAMILLFIPGSPVLACIAMFLIGFGNGPIFPNLTYLTPQNFGADISQFVIGTQMAASNIGIMLMPFLFGRIVKITGLGAFSVYETAMFALMLISCLMLYKRVKKSAK